MDIVSGITPPVSYNKHYPFGLHSDEEVLLVFLAIIVAHICISILNGWIAGQKGRDSDSWFFLSFFSLGIIAFIILACLPSIDKSLVNVPPVNKTEVWTCEYCSTKNNEGNFCKNCGAPKNKEDI